MSRVTFPETVESRLSGNQGLVEQSFPQKICWPSERRGPSETFDFSLVSRGGEFYTLSELSKTWRENHHRLEMFLKIGTRRIELLGAVHYSDICIHRSELSLWLVDTTVNMQTLSGSNLIDDSIEYLNQNVSVFEECYHLYFQFRSSGNSRADHLEEAIHSIDPRIETEYPSFWGNLLGELGSPFE